MAERLTDKTVKALPKKATIVFDDKLPGFAVRVAKSGTKTLLLDYRINGRQRRYTIGKYPAWSVAAAREQAGKLRQSVDLGHDPMANRKAAAGELTVNELADRYLAEYVAHKNAPRTHANYSHWLNRCIRGELGKRKITSVRQSDLRRLHRQISTDRPILANRTMGVVQRMYNYAIAEDLCSDNPVKGLEKNPEYNRDRYLSGDELRALLTSFEPIFTAEHTAQGAVRSSHFVGFSV